MAWCTWPKERQRQAPEAAVVPGAAGRSGRGPVTVLVALGVMKVSGCLTSY